MSDHESFAHDWEFYGEAMESYLEGEENDDDE